MTVTEKWELDIGRYGVFKLCNVIKM